ncbi:MAG: hypothetical protein OHK005_05920 [Candidatus Methylacidiphilales bacterium]
MGTVLSGLEGLFDDGSPLTGCLLSVSAAVFFRTGRLEVSLEVLVVRDGTFRSLAPVIFFS